MKIIFDRKKIIAAVAPTMYATANRAPVQAMEGILIDAAEGAETCVLTTYDGEKGIRTFVEATVLESGSCIINSQKFNQIIKVMDGEEITLQVDTSYNVSISSVKSSFQLHALPGKDFPNLPKLAGERGFSISQKVLRRMIAKIEHSIAQNNQRNVLNGCLFKVNKEKLMLVSCDTFKLSKCIKACELESKMAHGPLELEFVVPGKTLSELMKLISDTEDKLDIILTLKHVIFKIDDIYFFSRMIDSEYIDYERVIIKDHKIKVDISAPEFLGSLERAALVTEERIVGNVVPHVKLNFTEGTLNVSSVSITGRVYEDIDITHEGGDLEIGFYNRHLLDTLRAIDSDMLKLELSSTLMSMNIIPVGLPEGEEDIYMVLPMRMRD